MWLKTALPFAAIVMLGLTSVAAGAQETAPAAAAPRASYSDAQMGAFARATVELQALGTQDPEAQTRAIERSGMRVEDYNSMGDAMRADPKLAASLNPYLDEADAERRARIARMPATSRSYAAHSRQTVSAPRHRPPEHRRAPRAHGRRHATDATRGHHAKVSRHISNRRGHMTKKTRHHAASHATLRHKRHHG